MCSSVQGLFEPPPSVFGLRSRKYTLRGIILVILSIQFYRGAVIAIFEKNVEN